MLSKLRLPVNAQFHFEHTVLSHGWCALLPFTVTTQPTEISRVLRSPRGGSVRAQISSGTDSLDVNLHHASALSVSAEKYFNRSIRAIFNLDLDLSPFYRMIRRDKERRWMADGRAGRMLRGETFFEDVVKMILTTNCSWSLTTIMNRNLVDRFGSGGRPGKGFPVPEAIADSGERELREVVRLGYRAPFVLDLARRCVRRELEIEAFRTSAQPTAELYAELRSIRGVGDYAASNLLKLLGRFDYLGLDSWCRMKFSELYRGGVRATDAEIAAHYAPFEEWQGLVMWLDVTREWYSEKFPFRKDA